jgi:hypothetical protein
MTLEFLPGDFFSPSPVLPEELSQTENAIAAGTINGESQGASE